MLKKIRWFASVAAAACLPMSLAAQEQANLPQQIADVITKLNGGVHTGFRFMHAKGLIVTGTFTPAPSAHTLSKAAHLQTTPVPVMVRLSDGTGNPMIPDPDKNGSPRGMAIRFMLPGGAYTDIVAISHNGFVVGTGEDFLAFLTAISQTTATSPHPSPIEKFLGTHPRALKFLQETSVLSPSFANLAFFGNNAFVFVDAAGTKRTFRYKILPEAGLKALDAAQLSKEGPNYLYDDITAKLKAGPVKYKIVAQFPNAGDQTNDGSIVWPEDRKTMELGTLTLTTVAPDNATLQVNTAFNPIFLTEGIELSDDPLVPLRSAVYALSVAHRH